MANYGDVGPRGALRPTLLADRANAKDVKAIEAAVAEALAALGYGRKRAAVKAAADSEFRRIVAAQTCGSVGLTLESFIMAARQHWGVDARTARAMFSAANLRGAAALSAEEYLLLLASFHHKDTPAHGLVTRLRLAGLFHKYDSRGCGLMSKGDYHEFLTDLCAGSTHVAHTVESLAKANEPAAGVKVPFVEISLSDFSRDLMDVHISQHFQSRGLSGGDLLATFRNQIQKRILRPTCRSTDSGQGDRPELRVALDSEEMVARTAATAAHVAKTARCSPLAVTRLIGRQGVNAGMALDRALECEFDWRGPGSAPRGSALFEIAQALVERCRKLALQAMADERDMYDTDWLSGEAGGSLEAVLGSPDVAECARRFGVLAHAAQRIVASQPSLVRLRLPAKVFGDLHGQLRDVLLLFGAFGFPSHVGGDVELASYCFNGDFVDRGAHQPALLGLLFALKALYPNRIYLVRGNHEFRRTSEAMGPSLSFRGAVERQFASLVEVRGSPANVVYEAAFSTFEWLPIAALVGDRILVVHGGIGDGSWSLKDIETATRPLRDLDKSTPPWIIQALWSDPADSDADMRRGVHANLRGGNICTFGADVTRGFCLRNSVDVIVRSHQYVRLGYKYMHGGRLITLFSARNYFGREQNDGAVLLIARDGFGQIRVRPKRLPAVDADSNYPSLDTGDESPTGAAAARPAPLAPARTADDAPPTPPSPNQWLSRDAPGGDLPAG
ncbi:Metallo-dependent phosphatase-like protein [Pelagophyceae sp. CCMP2097]|nr:Metallo-dependent phosphatase-like protein [Pelagophyceae sp. CCMP2097]